MEFSKTASSQDEPSKMPKKQPKVCFAASSGGHYEQLLALSPLIKKYNGFIVTEKTSFASTVSYKSYYLTQLNRSEKLCMFNLIFNSFKSLSIFLKERPDVVVTTGVLACIPLCLICKLFGKKLVYIESFAKTKSATATGKFLYKYADRFYVQWESMLDVYPDAIFVGGVY